jgi:hypothetical protein
MAKNIRWRVACGKRIEGGCVGVEVKVVREANLRPVSLLAANDENEAGEVGTCRVPDAASGLSCPSGELSDEVRFHARKYIYEDSGVVRIYNDYVGVGVGLTSKEQDLGGVECRGGSPCKSGALGGGVVGWAADELPRR